MAKLFFSQMSGSRENGQNSQKSGRATILTLFTPNFMPSFGKILESGCVTHGRTNRTDFIDPSRFIAGDKKKLTQGP